MKIAVINGSHRGKKGNTHIMVSAFLKGATEAGAEVVNVFLSEKKIDYCKACKACWFKSPGKCVIKDDMADIVSLIKDADIRVLATPLYLDNISGLLKNFLDRMMVTASPYWGKDREGECRHLTTEMSPQLVMIANCGYPERSHFQVISHWIKRHARNLNTEVIAEIYASQGALLGIKENEVGTIVSQYLKVLETAGREIATNKQLTNETITRLEQKFIPDEIYIQEVKKYVDGMLGAAR
ncbi:flavodoxin family protein [Sporomusa rhizae]|uniref:flavodoxin family protein n=1 Tax=Sporomusa rhizae TaxID=357999 RepID=UPI00352B6631